MPRSRQKATHAQLDLEWTDTMRWEDLPATVRDRLRERLVAVLQQNGRGGAGAEAGHDAE